MAQWRIKIKHIEGSVMQMPRIKTADMHLRLTPAEKENLTARAAEARLSVSQYLLALSEQKKIIIADGLPELCRQIMKIGTNVNQIALVANTHKSVSEKQLDAVNENLMNVKDLLIKLIDTIQNSKDEIKV
ncbi:plasmid mobilization relaxosome protein MobC [Ruminococcus sp.]|nr:plasmid mobilization relaxosome protein MobC [Ruminococcus sp.]MBQ6252487.1 plasmid mobilization relaxosome protein MobC [Ruminococcus sp.]